MTQTKDSAILDAIREAVEAAVAEFGIDFIRTLSMFPSAAENQEELKHAA